MSMSFEFMTITNIKPYAGKYHNQKELWAFHHEYLSLFGKNFLFWNLKFKWQIWELMESCYHKIIDVRDFPQEWILDS